MRTNQFFILLAVLTWAALSISSSTRPVSLGPAPAAEHKAHKSITGLPDEHFRKLMRELEEREQALAERLKQPEPDEQLAKIIGPKVFTIYAEPRDKQAAAELKFQAWRATAAVICHPETRRPIVISCAHLLVTHEQSALIERLAKPLGVEPTWNNPDERLAIRIRDYRHNEFMCYVLKADPEHDVATFEIEGEERISPETITELIGRADEGAWVALCDSVDSIPNVKFARLGAFRFSHPTDFGTIGNLFEVALPLRHGSSGGPVFNQDGEFIGTISSSDNKTRSHITHWSSTERLLGEL